MKIQDLYQELIIDHGTAPRNCCALPTANHQAEGFNPLCGDKIKVYLEIKDGIIVSASFTGNGCAISTASASLMTESLTGKSLEEVLKLSNAFQSSLTQEKPMIEIPLGKLEALMGVRTFPARVKCATLAWHTLEAAIKQDARIVCTESIKEVV